jgi:high-affinity Fe2+/Pb2+ permease
MRSPGIIVFFVLLAILLTMASVRYGLGRLPGDIVIDTGSFFFYLPITTAIIVSALLSLVLWLFNRRR